jgi:hypothetical protein
MSGIHEITASVACTFQIASEPCPSWKTKTTIPYAAPSETRLRITALSGSTTERKARISRTNVRMRTNRRT